MEKHVVKRLPLVRGALEAHEADGALQSSANRKLTVLQTNGFEGLGAGMTKFTVGATPSDNNGSVSELQYIEWVNESFAVFDKKTGKLLYGPALGKTLWTGFGGKCESLNDGDPITLYDKRAKRWFMTHFAISEGPPYFQCIAVSTTQDALGTYARSAYQFDDFNDYGKFGIWPDGY